MTASERAAGELVADVDMLAAAIRRVDGNHDLGAGALAEALVAAGFGRIDAARREIAQAERRGAERALEIARAQRDAFLTSAQFERDHPEWIAGWHAAVKQVSASIDRFTS